VGAALGAVLVNFMKTWLTGAAPEFWLFGLGALFIVVTLFLPKGIIGTISQWRAARAERAAASAVPAE
jgi:urea transport system permease protein